MPIYEYECKACHREFEYQQRMADPEKTVCEACGKEELSRIISRTAFQLKGGGWYKDLYASSKPEAKSSETKSTETSTATTPAPAASTSTSSDSGSGSSGTSSGGTSSGGTPSGGGSGGGSSGGGGGTSSGGSSTKAAAGAS